MNIYQEIDEFIKSKSTESKNTIKSYKLDLMIYARWLEFVGLNFLTASSIDISRFVVWLKTEKNNTMTCQNGICPRSINRKLSAIRMFYEYLLVKYPSMLNTNPVRNAHYYVLNRLLPRPVKEEVIDRLLNGVTCKKDKAIYMFFLSGGFRLDELISLDKDSIILKGVWHRDREIRIGEVMVRGKGGIERIVYINESAFNTYLEYLLKERPHVSNTAIFLNRYGKRISARGVEKRLIWWCKKLGLPKFTIHQFRHTFATRMINLDVPIEILAQLLGHKSVHSTEIYAKISNKKVRDAYIVATQSVANA